MNDFAFSSLCVNSFALPLRINFLIFPLITNSFTVYLIALKLLINLSLINLIPSFDLPNPTNEEPENFE